MKTLDDQIREAFTALDQSVPDGYHDRFPSRIDKMLEVQAMAPETPDKPRERAGGDAISSNASKDTGAGPRENTGLHDIKAMARTTKERISRRVTTQSDVEASLLVSSSSGLKAVVLPEPGKEQATYETDAEASPAREAEDEARGGTPLWLFGAVGAVAVAAVVFFVVRGRGGVEEDKTAALQAPSQPVSAETGAAAQEPIVARLDPSAVEESEDEGLGADTEPADDSDSPEPTVSPITPDGVAAAEGVAATPEETSPKAAEKSDRSHDKRRSSRAKERDDDAKKKPAEAKPAPAATAPPPPPADKKPGGPRSLEDILDTEMGGAPDGSKGKDDKAAPVKKAPSKSELTGTDIRNGMRSVLGRVQSCYTQFKKPGTVKVSVTVSNDGSVSEAFAVGEFKGTPTGTCVATAVKAATFPAWDGRAKSFNYSYLLAD